jgi:hypothetical protein
MDSLNPHYSLRIPIDPPYFKDLEIPTNALGLQEKAYFTTCDLCKVLKTTPSTFRHRIYSGHYPEPARQGGKRRFTYEQAREIILTTKKLIKQGILRNPIN